MTPDEPLRVNRSLVIPAGELEWRFTPSGGPGGQHANRASTRAELRFDVAASEALGPRQRRRLLDTVGAEVVVGAGEERSQARNRSVARQRLAAKLADALRPQKRRRPTRPSRAAHQRRVEQKRRRGQKKRLRRPPKGEE